MKTLTALFIALLFCSCTNSTGTDSQTQLSADMIGTWHGGQHDTLIVRTDNADWHTFGNTLHSVSLNVIRPDSVNITFTLGAITMIDRLRLSGNHAELYGTQSNGVPLVFSKN